MALVAGSPGPTHLGYPLRVEIKEVDITCPCCESRLSVDVRTSRVLRWRAAPKPGEEEPERKSKDWGAAQERVTGRLGAAADKFDEGLQRERSREGDLDDLFRKANEKIRRKQDDD